MTGRNHAVRVHTRPGVLLGRSRCSAGPRRRRHTRPVHLPAFTDTAMSAWIATSPASAAPLAPSTGTAPARAVRHRRPTDAPSECPRRHSRFQFPYDILISGASAPVTSAHTGTFQGWIVIVLDAMAPAQSGHAGYTTWYADTCGSTLRVAARRQPGIHKCHWGPRVRFHDIANWNSAPTTRSARRRVERWANPFLG